jgi:hypothetical protein
VMAVLAAVIGFTHLLAGFDNPPWSEPSPPCWAAPTPAAKRPTICAGSNTRDSSSGCRAITATNSPRWAAASRCCSPRSMDVCLHPAWPS